MKPHIYRDLSPEKLVGLLPPSLKDIVSMRRLQPAGYTVLTFDTNRKHVTISATVRSALKMLTGSDRHVIAVGGQFTNEAMRLLVGHDIEVISEPSFGWTDASFQQIQFVKSAKVKARPRNSDVKIEHNPTVKRLEDLGVLNWPIWEKEVSESPWFYDDEETCYFLEGDVMVLLDNQRPVRLGKGDLVTFPKGLSCKWTVYKPVRKHYKFG